MERVISAAAFRAVEVLFVAITEYKLWATRFQFRKDDSSAMEGGEVRAKKQ
jgi:hypothetical protein